MKRMLYEEMGIKEYWVIDVQNLSVIGFMILDGLASKRIAESLVLPNLTLGLIE